MAWWIGRSVEWSILHRRCQIPGVTNRAHTVRLVTESAGWVLGRCRCGFCAWCLSDCGADAHKHVGRCPAKPTGADRFYGTMAQVNQVQRHKIETQLRQFLSELAASTKEKLLRLMRPLLADRLPGFAL